RGTSGRPRRWQNHVEIVATSWEMAVSATLHTTHRGLLSQPDKQKLTNALEHRRKKVDSRRIEAKRSRRGVAAGKANAQSSKRCTRTDAGCGASTARAYCAGAAS